jgi:hypothetical protein
MVHDLRIMYQYFQEYDVTPTADELGVQRKVLGHEPRNFDAFAAEVAPAWKSH